MNNLVNVVIILGPPGAGKGTQADLLVESFGFFHFETSKVIEEEVRTHDDSDVMTIDGTRYRYGDERINFETGILVTPAVVSFWIEQKIRELAAKGQRLVFSGSPRTLPESQKLVPLLEDLYGKDTIYSVILTIPPEESIHRNSNRRICSRCRYPVPYLEETKGLVRCPKCGGELVRRGSLDTPEVIKVRLKEYAERTAPIEHYLRERKISIKEVSGVGSIGEVAERIRAAFPAPEDKIRAPFLGPDSSKRSEKHGGL